MARLLACCCAAVWGAFLLYALTCATLLAFFLWPASPPPLLDEGKDVLADFFAGSCSPSVDSFADASNNPGNCEPSNFFFGLATAPAHVEDNLNDSWIDFAGGKDGHFPVRAWNNVPLPDQRLRFWTEPDIDLRLAKETGVTVFRLGIDWGRIVAAEPINGTEKTADKAVVEHYKWILQRVHDHGMQVMLTLFHHSIPKWAMSYGGWTDKRTVSYFVDFVRYAKEQFGSYVDYWITFNEPHIFVILSHCSGDWPPGKKLSTMESLICLTPFGQFGKAMDSIIRAHIISYDVLHEGDSKAFVGIAHNVGVIKPFGLLDVPVALASRWLMNFHWIDHIYGHLDFCGLNYYGQEILSVAGLILAEDEEYSEGGRGVYPDGLYELLLEFQQRYKVRRPNLRYIITENGFSDARDILRRPYLLEHLLAVHAAISQGVPIEGYLHWTVTDNWEWADGYCPKFGLVDVDRGDNLKRYPRPSYYLYKEIATTGIVTRKQREREWATLQAEINQGGMRPFCRSADQFNRMWADSLDIPVMRRIVERDWRFGKYQIHGSMTYLLRSVEVAKMLFHDAFCVLSGKFAKLNAPSQTVDEEL
eukprot:c27039_g2_i1 orf=213-1979(-)